MQSIVEESVVEKVQLLNQLKLWVDQSDLVLSAAQQGWLVDYVVLLHKWNRAYNLTSVRELEQMLTYHIMDSLMVSSWVKGQVVLDVGTGAGLPGIPLAIACPNKQFHLVDSNGKKIRFLQQVVYQLGLKNVSLAQSRVQSLGTDRQFDVIMARAVATLSVLIESTKGLLASGGQYLLQKGVYPEDELQDLSLSAKVESVMVPGLDAKRHVVIIGNKDNKW